eukprot:SAG11_NODE_3877_length_2175_cov_1.701349_2_plen_105_part_00
MVVEPEVGVGVEVAGVDARAGALAPVGGGAVVGYVAREIGVARAGGVAPGVDVVVVAGEVAEVRVEAAAGRRLRLCRGAAVPLRYGIFALDNAARPHAAANSRC